jgi:hypothetical protein
MKIAHLILIRQQTWPPQAILVSDFQTIFSSEIKPLCQMNRNLIGSIYGRSSLKIAHFIPIRQQIWLPQAILVFDW